MQSPMLFSFYLEAALKSAMVLVMAWVVVLVLRQRSAALRCLIWTVAFASVLVLPLLSMSLPRWHAPFGGSLLPNGLLFQVDAQNAVSEEKVRPHAGIPLNPGAHVFKDWPTALLTIWGIGAAVSLLQMLLGLVMIDIRRRRSHPVEMSDFESMIRLLAIRRKVWLFEGPAGSMPFVCGLLQPAVFIPADAAKWDAGRRRVVLLHELAHVKRLDELTHLFVRTALALYWWNPLIWAGWREFLKEREQAADDLVLNLGTRASDYANQLLEVAASMQSPVAFGWNAVPMGRPSQLESRVTAILDPHRDRRTPRWASIVTALTAAFVLLSSVAALQAKNDTAQSTAADVANAGPVGSVLIKEGDEAREQGKWEQAKSLYTQVLNISSSGPEAAGVLIHLGTVELNNRNYAQAMADFERAQAADASHAGEAKMWTAIVYQRQNNLELADTSFQEALALESPNSPSAVIIMKLRADLLKQQGRLDEAAALRNEADAIVKVRAEQAASQNQGSASDAYRIGKDVTAPVLLSKVEPQYAADARIAKYQGTVLLSVEIGVDGLAGNIKVVRGLGLGLDQKAVDAVHQWKFKPGAKDGQPVKVAAHVEVNFRLL